MKWLLLLALIVGCGKKDDTPSAKGSAATAGKPSADPKVAAFWKWFVEHADALRADTDVRKTMLSISDELKKIDDGVIAELAIDGAERTLVISADGHKDKFPTVQKIYDGRPSVAGWNIVAFRQRAKPGDPPLTIELAGEKIDPSDVKFVAKSGGDLKLDITVYLPVKDDKEAAQIGFVMLDHTVGEYDMETKIGGIDFVHSSKAPPEAKPLAELPAIVDALK
jgi:hypothetical protein